MTFSKLDVEQVEDVSNEGRGSWKLLSPLIYNDIEVPVGFVTDFASVPRIPFVFDLCGDRGNLASTVHDYLYSVRKYPRKQCDQVFRVALVEQGVKPWIARLMYWGVRLFGGSHY